MSYFTVGGLLAVLAIVLWGLWIAGRELIEFENGFVYVVWGLLLILVGGAAYLSIATPSLATHDAVTTGAVRNEQSNLLREP